MGLSLRTEVLDLPLSGSWAPLTAVVTAPPGTAWVSLDLSHSSGAAGTTVYFEDIAVRS